MKRHLPFALTTLRLLLGPIALAGAWAGVPRWIYPPLLICGTVSDILDGVLARRFGVATPALRRYDSITDVIYYLFILGAMGILCRSVVQQNWGWIALILVSEALAMMVCHLKFGTHPATHSWLAKFYGVCLLAALIALLGFHAGSGVVIALAGVALLANGEIIAMHLVADRPPVDVKSIFVLRRSGK